MSDYPPGEVIWHNRNSSIREGVVCEPPGNGLAKVVEEIVDGKGKIVWGYWRTADPIGGRHSEWDGPSWMLDEQVFPHGDPTPVLESYRKWKKGALPA